MSSVITHRGPSLDLAACGPAQGGAWFTASLRPVGMLCRCDADRLAVSLQALAATSSVVVLDLQAARIESTRVADVVGRAAALLAAREGCLLCVGADGPTRACLDRAGALVAHVASGDATTAPRPREVEGPSVGWLG